MLEPETLVRIVLGTFLVANAGIFFLAPESRTSRPPRRVAWTSVKVSAEDAARPPRVDDAVIPRHRGVAPESQRGGLSRPRGDQGGHRPRL